MCVHAGAPLARGLEPAIVVAAEEGAPVCVRSTVEITRRRLNVLAGEQASFTGTLQEGGKRAAAGSVIRLQLRAGHTWRTLSSTQTGSLGRFALSYRPQRPGGEVLRIAFAGAAAAEPATRPLGRLEVYRLAGASWYGGGGTLACGGELTSWTVGVANRTLPCGTLVTLRYDGHTVRVPVVDRGPFVEGREFDLTEATKRELGFGGTGEVWTTS